MLQKLQNLKKEFCFSLQKTKFVFSFSSSKIDNTASVWISYEPPDVVKEIYGSIEVLIDALESICELQKSKKKIVIFLSGISFHSWTWKLTSLCAFNYLFLREKGYKLYQNFCLHRCIFIFKYLFIIIVNIPVQYVFCQRNKSLLKSNGRFVAFWFGGQNWLMCYFY